MNRIRGKRLRLASIGAFLVLLWALLLSGAWAQILHPTIGEPENKATVALAKILKTANTSLLDTHLAQIGFTPPDAAADWGDFPVVRKLEAAYLAAEAGGKGGGAQMLRNVATRFSQKYETVKYEPALASFIVAPEVTNQKIAFGTIPASTVGGKADTATISAMFTLSKYCEGGAVGGAAGVLQDYFNLPAHQTYDILRTSGTTAEAIARGLAFVPETQRHPRMQLLVAHVDKSYGKAARQERDLDPWRKTVTISENHPPITKNGEQPFPDSRARPGEGGDRPPSASTGGGGGGGSPSGRRGTEGPSRAGINYERFVRSTYSGEGGGGSRVAGGGGGGGSVGEGIAFGAMSGIVEGFGGVVFGNSVESATTVVPREIVWIAPSPEAIAADPRAEGSLLVRCAGGLEKVYGPISPEDAWAAYHMVYRQIEGVKPARPGQGIGLVGVEHDNLQFGVTLDENGKPISDRRFRVVIHPALDRLSLGTSALLSDVLPIGGPGGTTPRLRTLVAKNSGTEAADALKLLFEDVVNWKLTDARLSIGADGHRLTVTRAVDPVKPRSAEFRQSYFLTMNGFRESDDVDFFDTNGPQLDRTFSRKFDDLLPSIVASSTDYARMNQFAAVLAVFRWANQKGAKFLNTPEVIRGEEAPAWVVMRKDGVEFLNYERPSQTQAAFHTEVDRRLHVILAGLPASASALLHKEQVAWDNVGKLAEAYSDSDTEVSRLKREWQALNLSVMRGIPAMAKDAAADYRRFSRRGFDGEAESKEGAKRLGDLRTKYAPASIPEFERLRKEIEAATRTTERDKLEAARGKLKNMDDIRRDLIGVVPDAAREAYQKARDDEKRFRKLRSEADSRADAVLEKLEKLDATEKQRVKLLTAAIQTTYGQLVRQVEGDKKSDAAELKLKAFRDARFPDIQAERQTAETEFYAALKQSNDLSYQAGEAAIKMGETFGRAFPGVEEWMRLAPLCATLIPDVRFPEDLIF